MIVARCVRGHEQGYWRDDQRELAERALLDPDFRRCDHKGCGRRRVLRFSPNPRLGVAITDIPEHFNLSFGERVRSRRHLKDLQKKHGCRDWEPVKEMPQTSNLKRAGLI